jgi:ABC-type transport system involved in cytochrome bd biosynthesis fused ATPase/permease subunit
VRGAVLLLALCAAVAALSILPPELARWFAIGLLVLVVLTPAVGRRYAAPKQDGEESKAAKGTGASA